VNPADNIPLLKSILLLSSPSTLVASTILTSDTSVSAEQIEMLKEMEGDLIELNSKLNKYVAAQSLEKYAPGVLVMCFNS
jgi:hypothetical protein